MSGDPSVRYMLLILQHRFMRMKRHFLTLCLSRASMESARSCTLKTSLTAVWRFLIEQPGAKTLASCIQTIIFSISSSFKSWRVFILSPTIDQSSSSASCGVHGGLSEMGTPGDYFYDGLTCCHLYGGPSLLN